jgi:signal recognition particle subunit SRP19
MCREYPKLSYTINPPTKPFSKNPAKPEASTKKSKKANSSTKQQPKKRQRLRTRPPIPPQPVISLEERLPLHSPIVHTGIAVSSIKRDLDNEKEQKKKGITAGTGEEGGGTPVKDKQPKMKRMVVRGKR